MTSRLRKGAWLITLCLGGCTSLSATMTTRDEFSQLASCPPNRVTVSPRGPAPVTMAPPPADVAADPDRLAIWNAQHPPGEPNQLYEADGCGQHLIYRCRHGSEHGDCGVGLAQFCCSPTQPSAPVR